MYAICWLVTCLCLKFVGLSVLTACLEFVVFFPVVFFLSVLKICWLLTGNDNSGRLSTLLLLTALACTFSLYKVLDIAFNNRQFAAPLNSMLLRV